MSTIETLSGGVTGGNILEVAGYERILFDNLLTPFEPSKLYRIRARIKNTVRPADPARNLIRVGVEGLAADGATLVDANGEDTNGNQYFVAAEMVDMGALDLDVWYDFTGYMKGQGAYIPNATSPDNASPLSAAVAFIMPVVWVNCEDGDGTCQIDAVFLDVLPENADQLAESETKKWAAESGATVGAVVGINFRDSEGNSLAESEIVTSQGTAADTAAVNFVPALNVSQVVELDPALVSDHSYAGRTGYFDVATVVTPTFGQILGLWPIDGKMYPANIYDSTSNGFMAVDLGLGTGRQKLALPGAIIRDDSLNLLTGRELFLDASAMFSGGFSHTEPAREQIRFVIGKALSPTTWLFDPQRSVTLRVDVPWMARFIYYFENESLNTLYEWNGGLYAGCSAGKIYRSTDWGLTWTNVYTASGGPGVYINAFCVLGTILYACADAGSNTGFGIYSTTDGTSWTKTYTNTGEPYAYDLTKEVGSNLLMVCTGNVYGFGKIFTSPDGVAWTLRYTSPTESDIIRFAGYSTTYNYAIEGYATAKTLISSTGTTWSIRNTYTGATSPTDLMAYTEPANGLKYVCACVGDTGVIYGGTTTISTAEKTDANIWWETFIILDGYLHCIGTKFSPTVNGVLYKRNVVSDGAGGWIISWVKVADSSNITAWRHLVGSNGFTYFVSLMDDCVYRISKLNHVLT